MDRVGHQVLGNESQEVACTACRSYPARCSRAGPCSDCLTQGSQYLPVTPATNFSSSTSSPTFSSASVSLLFSSASSSSTISSPSASSSTTSSSSSASSSSISSSSISSFSTSSSSASLGSSLSTSSVGMIISSPDSDMRKAGFHRFVTILDQCLSEALSPQIIYFWKHGLIPAAQSNDTLMNAVLCKEIINTMPKQRLMLATLPVRAIEYYVESLRRPFRRLEDLPLLLMTAIIYLEAEQMLSHYQNMAGLAHSIMWILYSNKKMLWQRYHRNHLVFAILSEILRHVSEAPIDNTSIPLYLWREVHSFILKLGFEINVDGSTLLELQLYDIQFRLSRSDFDNPTFHWKFVTWEHNMTQQQREMEPGSKAMRRLEHIRGRLLPSKIIWNFHQFHIYRNNFCEQVLRASIELQTQKMESILKQSWVPSMVDNPLMHPQVFIYIVPRIAHTLYYARDKVICQRLVKVLSAFRPWLSYYDNLVDYLEAITETQFGCHTPREIAYLGPNLPSVLTTAQLTRVVDQIATCGAIDRTSDQE